MRDNLFVGLCNVDLVLDNVALGFTLQCLGLYLISTWVLFHIKWLLLLL